MVLTEELFDGGCVEVLFLNDVDVIEAVLLYFGAESFHVPLDFEEVCEALFFRVAIFVLNCPADGRIVDVADDQTLPSIRGEVRHNGLFRFALHGEGVGKWFCGGCFTL